MPAIERRGTVTPHLSVWTYTYTGTLVYSFTKYKRSNSHIPLLVIFTFINMTNKGICLCQRPLSQVSYVAATFGLHVPLFTCGGLPLPHTGPERMFYRLIVP